MDFGTFLLLQSPSAEPSEVVFGRGIEITQAADELGFRNMWLAEHHFSTYGYLSRPLTYALHLANKTKRLRIGTAVIVLPLHHPLVVAEEIATVDLLSGGRLDVGLGRGYQHYEFERLGVDLNESRARWEEEVDVILLALQGEAVHATTASTTRSPRRPCSRVRSQQPHPPIWVTAQSLPSVEATVRRGFNIITGGSGVPIERLREFREALERAPGHLQAEAPDQGRHAALHLRHRQRGRRPRGRRAGPLEHARHPQPAQQLLHGSRTATPSTCRSPTSRPPTPSWTSSR